MGCSYFIRQFMSPPCDCLLLLGVSKESEPSNNGNNTESYKHPEAESIESRQPQQRLIEAFRPHWDEVTDPLRKDAAKKTSDVSFPVLALEVRSMTLSPYSTSPNLSLNPEVLGCRAADRSGVARAVFRFPVPAT